MTDQKSGPQLITLESGMKVTVNVPNDTFSGDGFYISYNDRDASIYGSVTTALVIGQMERFFILNGDHTAAYRKIINDGLEACMAYFEENIDQINKRSDKPEAGVPGLKR